MLQFRVGLFWGGATLAGMFFTSAVGCTIGLGMTLHNRLGAFSGLLAFGISFMNGRDGLLGWSWIFVRTNMLLFICFVVDAWVTW